MVQFTVPMALIVPPNTKLIDLRRNNGRGYSMSIDGFAIFNLNTPYPLVSAGGRCIAMVSVTRFACSDSKSTKVDFEVLSNAKNVCQAYDTILSYHLASKDSDSYDDSRFDQPDAFIPGALPASQISRIAEDIADRSDRRNKPNRGPVNPGKKRDRMRPELLDLLTD